MRHPFEAALEDAERAATQEPARAIRIGVELVASPAPGGHSLWELAAAWTPEADPPALGPAPPRPSAEPQDVARELGLDGLTHPHEIARARRRFMWDNHPDRRAEIDADLANRRVAVANMLLDGALARLQGRRGR